MKLQFDPGQAYQLDAISAVVDLFEGQPQGASDMAVIRTGGMDGLFAGQERTELGMGNALALPLEKLLENLRAIQLRNDIEAEEEAAMQTWGLTDPVNGQEREVPHFSVEMETGTGKTYVYLRTIFELYARYGFSKFIIVVPSVAIREGVLKNIDVTKDHFRALYGLEPEHFVYDAKRPGRLRQFATANTLQVMVMNIDAFRKADSNVIYKESDKLSGRQPIEFVQAARPIVIIDEPQSVDNTEKAQEAIKALNPLCTLRYSATHRNPYELVYRLDPVRAFELKLVKRIIVGESRSEGGMADAYVKLESVEYKKGITAKLRYHEQGANGPVPKAKKVKVGDDLYKISKERAAYQQGFEVAEIHAEPGNQYLRFSNGITLKWGEEHGGMRDDIQRAQIRHTVKAHLDKELRVRERGIKVLSLFFIDRVANYRDYDEQGHPRKGKFASIFEEAIAEFAQDPRYAALDWLKLPVEQLHNGYFAADKKGVVKDTRGDTQADDQVYDLIMKDKERLLSMEEPLRFIFSHSALREGWDNPNVFQICTLKEAGSAVSKRQEIGRGLRLPVDQDGKRVFDESINKLFVMATESYEDFARGLQQEYEADCGVTFGKVPLTALAKLEEPVDDALRPIGKERAKELKQALVAADMMDDEGRLLPAFEPNKRDFRIPLPVVYAPLHAAIVDLLASYQLHRHIGREKQQGPNKLKKEVLLTPEFQALWERIKPRTTYRVEFATELLIGRCAQEIKRMPEVKVPKVITTTGALHVTHGGVEATGLSSVNEPVSAYGKANTPDVLAYLQNETELTRGTLVKMLVSSGRLPEFFNDPQRFLDQVATIIKHELHRTLVDGIKYERIPGGGPESEWEQLLFQNDELIDYLNAVRVEHSIYDHVVYDSEVERRFAEELDQRNDIKLFVKLPGWFKVETPVGTYNPDWAIVKPEDPKVYFVRETKSNSKDHLKLRTSEADKIRCGKRHFEALGVDFEVVSRADEI